jgi:hypothetical protein
MSTSAIAYRDFGAGNLRRPVRKISPQTIVGSAAVGCLVLGCAWTVYANILGAGAYPQMSSASFDAPVMRRPSVSAVSSPPPAFDKVFAAVAAPAATPAAPATVASRSSLSFADRFGAAAAQGVAPSLAEAPKPQAPKLAEASKPQNPARPQVVASLPAPRQVAALTPAPAPTARPADAEPAKSAGASVRDMAQRAKAAVIAAVTTEKTSIFEKLYGKPQSQSPSHGSLLAYASADASSTGSLGPSQNPALEGSSPRYDQSTAVYDISAHTVYLPDGTKLEAHSGLGSRIDDPRYVKERMHGATPPHVYELQPREALFHGVAALRLNPIGGEEAIFGRSGLLAHTYMLGPNGASNGCVSFKDYNAFLNAYRNQGIKRLAVVASVE